MQMCYEDQQLSLKYGIGISISGQVMIVSPKSIIDALIGITFPCRETSWLAIKSIIRQDSSFSFRRFKFRAILLQLAYCSWFIVHSSYHQ